jgi:ubiquinone/menaquinone biosynthesis C-methylase UbiE
MSTPSLEPHATTRGSHAAAAFSAPLDHPLRGRFNAWFFWLMDAYLHRTYGASKQRLFAGLPRSVVELGPGVGANLRYLAPGSQLFAVEPNPHMHGLLARKAKRRGVQLTICATGAESIPLPDASVDAVICTLVLCTVPDPEAALREVRRILRPGGTLLCIEHVAAPAHTLIGRIQRWVYRPWRWLFEGCHTHRETAAALRAAGFGSVELEELELFTLFLPVKPQIMARAVR